MGVALNILTLGRTRKRISHRSTKKEGGLKPFPWVFAVLQYLGNILPLKDSLSCDLEMSSRKLGNCKYFLLEL